jgi:hypothetical protein
VAAVLVGGKDLMRSFDFDRSDESPRRGRGSCLRSL